MTRRKVIVTVAPTGGLIGKAAAPHLPTQPQEIADAVQACVGLGASVAAIHARRTDDTATCEPEIYRSINGLVRQSCDVVINNSTGGGVGPDLIRVLPDGRKEVDFNARLRATSETLGQSVGMTQKQMEAKAESILAAQRVATSKLEAQQEATSKRVGDVSNDVASVKTDVGGVKTNVATNTSDLQATKTQLNRVMGDAGVMSGLIATNRSELEVLKHKGDRNYLEFTLQKGAKPTLLSTIKIKLKKVDMKHSRYTLEVSADDRNIEKKDRTLDEPVQFYTGKNPVLYEIVVNDIEKHSVSGYLSTPK